LEKALQASLNTPRAALLSALMVAAFWLPSGAQAQIDIVFDYSYDSGFFADANRKAILEMAASDIEARLVDETFGAITPTGSNTWTLSFSNPGDDSARVSLNNLNLAANTLKIYVGGTNLGSLGPLGFADFGLGFSGNSAWFNQFDARNSNTNYDPLGGGITFNSAANWYFGASEAAQPSAQYDFYSVAAHEIFHILGFGQGAAYAADLSADGKTFAGANVVSLVGAPVIVDWINNDRAHWDQEVTFGGQSPLMVPALVNGQRNAPTELDYAVLRDIGYNVTSAVPEPATWWMALLGVAALGARRRRSAGTVTS
jgi:MYXO-CTERM domain-containing protein